MTEATLVDLTLQAMILVLMLSLPPIIMASLVGIVVSLFQALTQIQEQTLSYAIKLVVVTITLILSARWMGSELFTYSQKLFDTFPLLVR
ncbi:MAG: type III secretion system export apparatus subunit SctS [Pseudomonadota bacterium]|jgi:type III secretion protein S